MDAALRMTIAAATAVAGIHTLAGPDHYIPFIALSKTRGWKLRKTLFWTTLCGCAHVWSSVLLGLIGASIGWSLHRIGWLEGVRGSLAGWGLLVFGFAYAVWGLIRAVQNRPHKHFDMYEDGEMYVYEHKHGEAIAPNKRYKVTPWVLFIIFVLGPCEPMIPLLFVPAVSNNTSGMILLIIVYTIVTLLTMLLMVWIGYKGLGFLQVKGFERYMHLIAGATLFVCGAGMVFMGW